METVEEILARMQQINDTADLTSDLMDEYEGLEAKLKTAQRQGQIRARQAAYEQPTPGQTTGQTAPSASGDGHPLAFTAAALSELQAAITERRAARVSHDITNAALTTSTYGAPRVWGANVLAGPRLLHRVAGVPRQPVDAILAQIPNLTLPTATAGVGENSSLTEFAASTAGSVTLARFGRFTDLSQESLIGTDPGAIVSMHQIGIAKDLDKVLTDAVEAAAGAAVGFTADVPAAIRKAIAQVIDNTAAADSSELVILVNPADANLLQAIDPISGSSVGEGFQLFSGALVYPTSAADSGFMTVANLRAGARYFEARGVVTEAQVASVKTGTTTVATDVICGYGLGLTGGFAVKVDVVTP